MRTQNCLTLFGLVNTCILIVFSSASSQANTIYSYDLPPLLAGCLLSPTNPQCYDDQNVVRASGFSHFDGSGAPALQGTIAAPFDALLAQQPLWQRLYDTQVSMHVIDKTKTKTLLQIVNGSEIYTDEDYNSWRQFNGEWYVKMAHQFNTNDSQEYGLWCGSVISAISSCTGSGGGAEVTNEGVSGGPIFFAPILAENAPQEEKAKVNLGDWLRARPTEYDLANPESVNARANFFIGGRGIGFPYDALPPGMSSYKAFWNQVALVWVNPDQLFRPAQNPNISISGFAANAIDHFSPIQGLPIIDWCINQFPNVMNPSRNNQCDMAADQTKGNHFDDFRDYYLSYYNAGSNEFQSDSNPPINPFFFPFPFTGLGVTYDPYYQAQLEASATEAELSAILPSLIGTSEFIYSIPKSGQTNTAKMYLDEVYPIISTVPGPLPILGVGASFAFTRRLRRRIRLAN